MAFSLRSQRDPSAAPRLRHYPDESDSAFAFAHAAHKTGAAQRITIPVSIYNAWVMLGFGGRRALRETIQLFGREGGGEREGQGGFPGKEIQ